MITQTTELAIKTLMLLAVEQSGKPTSPKQIARVLGCSPSYLAKTTNALVRAGILRSVRGTSGGVLLARKADEIRLLGIIEACQGPLIGDYCSETAGGGDNVCAFHIAMMELQDAMVQALKKWTLKDLLRYPAKSSPEGMLLKCRMSFQGCEELFAIAQGKVI